MRKIISRLLLLFLFPLFFPAAAGAQEALFRPFTYLRFIETEHFRFIFPDESESTTRLLASRADSVYAEVSSLLGIEIRGRIPVTITPHTDLFNGFYSGMPRPHIVLYDTPMDPEWTGFEHNIESLFRHELTHAVSLGSRGPFFRALHTIFGNWVTPTVVTSPLFMTEGVTVSFESLSGAGRANDPLIKQRLRQAIHEGKFLSPFQASNVTDAPNQSGAYYEYGGLFSSWLQTTYGAEKYAELWQTMGRRFGFFSFFVYRSGFYRLFKSVYGLDFTEAWEAFGNSLDPGALETNADEILPKKYRFFSEKAASIRGPKANGENLYFLDTDARKLFSYSTESGKTASFNAGYSPHDFDIARNGETALVSGFGISNGRYRAIVTEYRADSGRKTGRSFSGMYKARYFHDGVIGIGAELHNNSLVYESFDGKRETLFTGNESLMFSGPEALDDDRVVFTAMRNGRRELWLYFYGARELYRVETDPDGGGYWRYMRETGVSGGRVFFGHDSGGGMYKLSALDLDAMSAVFSERNFSGGVQSPAAVNGEIYYRGEFFSGGKLLRFPEKLSSLSGKRLPLRLVPLDAVSYNAYADETGEESAARTYTFLSYMNPLRFWLPLPLIRFSDSSAWGVRFDGGGIYSLMGDPAERNLVSVMAYADIHYRMAALEDVSWTNTWAGFPLTLGFSDTVIESAIKPYRSTSVVLSGSAYWSAGQWLTGFRLGGGYIRNALGDAGESAYGWGETRSSFYASTGFTLSNMRRAGYEIFGTGARLGITGISFLPDFLPRFEGLFEASAEWRFPVSFSLYGVLDYSGMDIHGVSNSYGGSVTDGLFVEEYDHPAGLEINWLAGGELSLGLFSFEIQKNLSHVYYNRLFGVLSVRNALYDPNGHPREEGLDLNGFSLLQSLRLKLAVKTTFFPVVKTPLVLEPYVMGAWKFTNTVTGAPRPFYLTLGVNTAF